MTAWHRVCVVQPPSPTETLWREAIVHQAGLQSWTVHDLGVAEDWPQGDANAHAVFFATGAEGAEKLEPTAWVIVVDTPTTSANMIGGAIGEPPHSRDSLIHASARLGTAAMVSEYDNVTLVDARSLSADLPGLGEVIRRDIDLPRFDHEVPQPLAMFDRLPAPVSVPTIWPPEVFSYPKGKLDQGGQPDLDLTGRARTLVCGPFIHLPPGSWRIEIDLEVDPECGQVPLLFQWGAAHDFVSCQAVVTQAGRYSLVLDRDWPTLQSSLMRISLPQPVFQGRMTFLGSRVTRTPEGTPQSTDAAPD